MVRTDEPKLSPKDRAALDELCGGAEAVVRGTTCVDWTEVGIVLANVSSKMHAEIVAKGAEVGSNGVAMLVVPIGAFKSAAVSVDAGFAYVMLCVGPHHCVTRIESRSARDAPVPLGVRRAKIRAPSVVQFSDGSEDLALNAAATVRWMSEMDPKDINKPEMRARIVRMQERIEAAKKADATIGRTRHIDDLLADVCHVEALSRAMKSATEGGFTIEKMFAIILATCLLLLGACGSYTSVDSSVDVGEDAGVEDAGPLPPVTNCTSEDATKSAPCVLPPGVGLCRAEGCCLPPGEGVDACADGGAS